MFGPALDVAQRSRPFRGRSRRGSAPPAWFPLIWFKMSGSVRCDPCALVAQQPQLRAAVAVGNQHLAPARPVLRQREIVREVGRVGREELRGGDRARARHVAADHAARRHSAARGREGAAQALAVGSGPDLRAAQVQRARRLPRIDPLKAPKCSFASLGAPCSRPRSADVPSWRPCPAGTGSQRRSVSMASGCRCARCSRRGAQDGVALQLEASHHEAGGGHGALADGAQLPSTVRVGSSSTFQGGQRDVVGPASAAGPTILSASTPVVLPASRAGSVASVALLVGAVHGCRGAAGPRCWGALRGHHTLPARRRPCLRDPWSASSEVRRCCSRAQPPARPWWPGCRRRDRRRQCAAVR